MSREEPGLEKNYEFYFEFVELDVQVIIQAEKSNRQLETCI